MALVQRNSQRPRWPVHIVPIFVVWYFSSPPFPPPAPHSLRLLRDASVAPLCLSPTQQIEKHARVEAGAEGILRAVARRTHALRTIESLALHFLLDHLALKLVSIVQPLTLFFNLCRSLRHGTCA